MDFQTLLGLGFLSPEARAAVTGTALPRVTLREARAIYENTPGLSKADTQKLKNWLHAYEVREEAARQYRIKASAAQDTEAAASYALAVREAVAELVERRADAERGRVTAAQLRQAVEDKAMLHRTLLAEADAMAARFADREALAAADLADLQDQKLERVPSMRVTLPVLLGDWSEPVHPIPSAATPKPTNVNPAASMRGHADELYGAITDALRTVEELARREATMAGPKDNPHAERFEALRSRVA